MDKVRMKVEEAFSRNLDGQIVVGHPKHPDKQHRFVHVSEESAQLLEDAKQARRYSLEDEARDRVEGNLDDEDEDEGGEGDEHDDESEDASTGTGDDVGSARTTDVAPARAATKVRERKLSTTGKAGNGGRRGRPAKAPTGGHETNATTNNATTSTAAGSSNTGDQTNTGANSAPDPDAAP